MTALARRFAFCPSRPFSSLSYVSRRFGVERCVQRGVQRGAAYIIPLCTAFGVHFFSCTFFFASRIQRLSRCGAVGVDGTADWIGCCGIGHGRRGAAAEKRLRHASVSRSYLMNHITEMQHYRFVVSVGVGIQVLSPLRQSRNGSRSPSACLRCIFLGRTPEFKRVVTTILLHLSFKASGRINC
jgi:hypothetical protein